MLDYCEAEGIGFIPWFPLDAGKLAGLGHARRGVRGARRDGRARSRSRGCSSARRSMLPIPGTSSVAHLDENVAAAGVEMPDAWFERLSAA